MAQSVKLLTSAQVMISQFVGSSPTLGSMLTAQGLDGACFRFCVSLSLCTFPAHVLSLCLSLSKIKKALKSVSILST